MPPEGTPANGHFTSWDTEGLEDPDNPLGGASVFLFINKDVGLAGGWSSKGLGERNFSCLWRTEDGGYHWKLTKLPGHRVKELVGVDGFVYAVTEQSYKPRTYGFWESHDLGLTWKLKTELASPYGVNDLYFRDTLHGFMRADGYYLTADGGNDEREQTLNQLLTEMDGFDGRKGVVISAATNRPESLDKALLRPGRFDRRIQMELPDLEGRKAIIEVHLKHVKHEAIDMDIIARATAGSSGAELANIVNEAALRAVRMGRAQVTTADLEESVETVIAGAQKKNKIISVEEKKVVAYHEIGHALVAALQTHSAPVHKITIIPRTSGALGYTMQVEGNEQVLQSREDLFNRIVTLTGGRSAEEVVFNTVTTGASNDIEQATKLARAMVTRFGMSGKYDMMGLETVNDAYLGGDASLACSAETAADIDREVLQMIKEAHEKAKQLITGHLDVMHRAAEFLIERETIIGEEFMKIVEGCQKQQA